MQVSWRSLHRGPMSLPVGPNAITQAWNGTRRQYPTRLGASLGRNLSNSSRLRRRGLAVLILPQQTGVPSARMAHLCRSPLLMAMKPPPAKTAGGDMGIHVLASSGAAVAVGNGIDVAACSARGVGASVASGEQVGSSRSAAHAVNKATARIQNNPYHVGRRTGFSGACTALSAIRTANILCSRTESFLPPIAMLTHPSTHQTYSSCRRHASCSSNC